MEKFSPAGEKEVTRAIVSEFAAQFNEYVESDCIIIGGGPSGLMAGRILANAGNLKDKAVYAHTYIYSPNASWVFMRLRASKVARVLLNGEPLGKGVHRNTWRVQLKQGWNRLLARVLSTRKGGGSQPDNWSEGAASFNFELYGAEAEETYAETGMLWTVEPPQAGQASYYQPIILGDRIYVTSSPAFLICYDKLTGKRLWLRDNNFYEFITAEERQASPELFAEIDFIKSCRNQRD